MKVKGPRHCTICDAVLPSVVRKSSLLWGPSPYCSSCGMMLGDGSAMIENLHRTRKGRITRRSRQGPSTLTRRTSRRTSTPGSANSQRAQAHFDRRSEHVLAAIHREVEHDNKPNEDRTPVRCVASDDCAQMFHSASEMVGHFDKGMCGSRMSLERAYKRAEPSVKYGGPLTRARAKKWIGRYVEQQQRKRSNELGDNGDFHGSPASSSTME